MSNKKEAAEVEPFSVSMIWHEPTSYLEDSFLKDQQK
jgi:hypothetical protein